MPISRQSSLPFADGIMSSEKKFLFVTLDGLVGDVAWQLVKEQQQVKMHIANESEKSIADGFVPKVDDWESHVDWADVIVFDDVHGPGRKGWQMNCVLRASMLSAAQPYTDRLEDDRSFGQNELRKHGVSDHSASRNSTDFDSRRSQYVEVQSGVRMSSNRAARHRTSSGCCSSVRKTTAADVIHVLQSYKAVYADTVKVFQLQRRVRGVEVAVGAFFNGNGLHGCQLM